MQVIESITVDVSQNYLLSPIFAKQVDDGTRFLKIKLTDNGVPIQPESGSIARFRGVKPDQHSFDNVSTINSDGSITVVLTDQVLACAGFVECDVAIEKNEKILSCANFVLHVQKLPVNGNMERSSNEFTYLLEKTKEAEAWAKGRTDFPERATDNAKYYAEQAAAAVGLALVDDVTGASYRLGVHDGNLFIEQIFLT